MEILFTAPSAETQEYGNIVYSTFCSNFKKVFRYFSFSSTNI